MITSTRRDRLGICIESTCIVIEWWHHNVHLSQTCPYPRRAKSLAVIYYQYTQYVSMQAFFHPAPKAEFATTYVQEYPIIIVPFTSLARLEIDKSFSNSFIAWTNLQVLHCLDKFGHLRTSLNPALKSQHAWNVRCASLSVCLTSVFRCSLWATIFIIGQHIQSCSIILQRGRSPNWMSGISNAVDHPSDWLVQVRGPVVELMCIQVHQTLACNHTAQRKQPLSISAKRKHTKTLSHRFVLPNDPLDAL